MAGIPTLASANCGNLFDACASPGAGGRFRRLRLLAPLEEETVFLRRFGRNEGIIEISHSRRQLAANSKEPSPPPRRTWRWTCVFALSIVVNRTCGPPSPPPI